MFKSLRERFTAIYNESDFLTRVRARLLFSFEFYFALILVVILIIFLATGSSAFYRFIKIAPFFFTGVILSLVALAKGKYEVASSVFVLFASFVLVTGIITNAIIKPDVVFTTYVYFANVTVIFATVFTAARVITIVAAMSAVGEIVAYFFVRAALAEADRGGLTVALVDSLAGLAIVYGLCMIATRITGRNLELALMETARSNKQNAFIKETLQSSSGSIVRAAQDMSGNFGGVAETIQSQAASIEEVTASIEQISAGIDNIAESAQVQSGFIEKLTAVMKELSEIMNGVSAEVRRAFDTAAAVTETARSGERSLMSMNESMNNIRGSSLKMSDIVQIINDISDKINLLSLNAAIEAARAGDAGRGFAVVADEISKLADQTASSIKEIDTLIKANETEIMKGSGTVAGTVETISGIIREVGEMSGVINSIFDRMKQQIETNESVNRNALSVRERSDEILGATGEQKIAIDEIVRTISVINDQSQQTASAVEEMTGRSGKLVNMIRELEEKIEGYEG